MSRAVTAVREGRMKVASAARAFGVPRQTLSDRIHDTHAASTGRPLALSEVEETALVDYLNYMSLHG